MKPLKLAVAITSLFATTTLMHGTMVLADFKFTDESENFTLASADAGTNWTTSVVTDTVNGGQSNGDFNSSTPWGVEGEPDLAFQTTFSEMASNFDTEVDYLEFTITPNTGYSLDLTSISFYVAKTGGSNAEVGVKSSVDNFSTFLLRETVPSTGNTLEVADYTPFSSLLGSSFENLTDPVTFRLLMHDGGAGNQSNIYRLDEIRVEGTAAIPEPANAALLLALSSVLVLLRRRT